MSIQLLVFDMAGTTVKDNNNVHTALQQAFAIENIQISREEANEVMGYPKPVAIRQLLKLRGYTEPEESFVQQIFENFQEEMVRYYQHHPEVREIEGVSKLLAELKKHGLKIALDTGFDRRIADTIIKRLGWQEQGLIDVSITSDEVANGRPYPDMIFTGNGTHRRTVHRASGKNRRYSFDMQQGYRARCRYVMGVTTGAFTREALAREPHTHIISRLSELLPIYRCQA
jgi:phosphonatase-like hydrolase